MLIFPCRSVSADNFDIVLGLLSTSLSLVIRPIRHHTVLEGGIKYGGRGLAKKLKKHQPEPEEIKRPVGELSLSACEARRLYGICVELLELCSHVSGRIDPQAGWMVAHARDEVMLGIFDVKP
jgi:hypothetical protein